MNKFVAILMGSDSDLSTVSKGIDTLKKLNIPYEVKITSAHRTPEQTKHYVNDAESRGCSVFICAAGMAAHLAGAVAAQTLKPVIGIPINASLDGLDSLLSTVQMPAGMPVATVAIGSAGAQNAAYLAAQILAVNNQDIADSLVAERKQRAEQVIAKDRQIQSQI